MFNIVKLLNIFLVSMKRGAHFPTVHHVLANCKEVLENADLLYVPRKNTNECEQGYWFFDIPLQTWDILWTRVTIFMCPVIQRFFLHLLRTISR